MGLCRLSAGSLAPRLRNASSLHKRRQARDFATDEKGVDFVGPFIGVEGFEVAEVSHHLVVLEDAVATEDATSGRGDVARNSGSAGFGERGHPWGHLASVRETTQLN